MVEPQELPLATPHFVEFLAPPVWSHCLAEMRLLFLCHSCHAKKKGEKPKGIKLEGLAYISQDSIMVHKYIRTEMPVSNLKVAHRHFSTYIFVVENIRLGHIDP